VKHDGRREPYDRQKVLAGLKMACIKRPVSTERIEQMADDIENQIQANAEGEIDAKAVGELAMRQLHQVDEVAYVRFASVYRKFKEVKEFLSEISVLQQNYV
jgi:transcriptional repressor NrdR